MMKLKVVFSILLCAIVVNGYAQIGNYKYLREIQGKENEWHRIEVPMELYAKVKSDLTDLRVYGVNQKGDTLEAAYFIEKHDWELKREEIAFDVINRSRKGGNTYFTFKLPTEKAINRIQLDFVNANFDWNVRLEGSHNQQEWFEIVRKQRVLSIRNSYTDYAYTTLRFPKSQYKYWRVRVSGRNARLDRAFLQHVTVVGGNYRTYPLMKFEVKEDQANKQTIVNVDLLDEVPVSYLQLSVKDEFDYYRPVRLKYRTRIQAAQPIYTRLSSGWLTSFDENQYHFRSQITNGIQCIISNDDNQALALDTPKVIGPSHSLVVRFTEDATYYLAYGNEQASKARYDIVNFKNKIPDQLKLLKLGKEVEVEKSPIGKTDPLFVSQVWLWVVLVVLVLILGGFGFKMMKE